MNEVQIKMLETVLILMMMLNRARTLILNAVYLNSLLKYGMADSLHMMESYFQTPWRLAFAAAAAAIQMLWP